MRGWRRCTPFTIACAIYSGEIGLRNHAGNAASIIFVTVALPPKATLAIGVAVQPDRQH